MKAVDEILEYIHEEEMHVLAEIKENHRLELSKNSYGAGWDDATADTLYRVKKFIYEQD